MIRAASLAFGLSCGVCFSQAPEFGQQYLQRLSGSLSTMAEVIAEFDASASAEGLNRTEALGQLRGTDFLDRRRDDVERLISRHDRLATALQDHAQGGLGLRSMALLRLWDRQTIQDTWQIYHPALALTTEGGIWAIAGFLLGLLTIRFALWPTRFRARREKRAQRSS